MENCSELCTEMEEFDGEIFEQFKCEAGDLTKEKIKAVNINRQCLLDVIIRFGEIYTKTKSFSRSAANKVEELTSRVMTGQEKIIALQGDLIAAKDEQLAHVRTAVKEEIASVQSVVQTEIRSSWSDVVAKGSSSSITTASAAKLKEAVKSAVAEQDKSRNFMIFSKEEMPKEEIHETVAEILLDLNQKPQVVECMRVGNFEQGKPRPIKVKLASSDAVFNILRNAKCLKTSCKNKATFIGPDRSKEERAEHKKLVDKMKSMMRDEPEKYHFIRRGVITSVKK